MRTPGDNCLLPVGNSSVRRAKGLPPFSNLYRENIQVIFPLKEPERNTLPPKRDLVGSFSFPHRALSYTRNFHAHSRYLFYLNVLIIIRSSCPDMDAHECGPGSPRLLRGQTAHRNIQEEAETPKMLSNSTSNFESQHGISVDLPYH